MGLKASFLSERLVLFGLNLFGLPPPLKPIRKASFVSRRFRSEWHRYTPWPYTCNYVISSLSLDSYVISQKMCNTLTSTRLLQF